MPMSAESDTIREFPLWMDEQEGLDSSETDDQPLSSRTDVLVIGSGYTGMTAALRLSQNGAKVLVVDKEPIGSAASSRNGGLVLSGLNVGAASLFKTYGPEVGHRLFSASVLALDCVEQIVREGTIDCSFMRCGHVQAAFRPAHLEALKKEQALLAEKCRYETRLLTSEALQGELKSALYCGGLLDPGSAGIQPAKYMAGLARTAAAAGVELHSGVECLDIARQSGHFIVRTSRKTILADEIVAATNGYTGSPLPWLQRRIVPVDSLIIATEVLPPETRASLIPRNRVISDTKRFLYYFRLSPDGKRLIFGGRPRFMHKGLIHNAERMYQDLCRVFPQLSGIGISHAWTGKVGFSRDFLPHLGKNEGLWYALGYGGHGVALATYLGDRLAAWIQGREEAPVFAQTRFPAFPLYNGKPWFLPIVHTTFALLDRIR